VTLVCSLLLQFFVYWTSLCDWLNSSIQQLQQPIDSSAAQELEQFAVKLLVTSL